MSETPPQTAVLLNEALALHSRGQFDAAAVLYRQILAREPQHFDALHLFGALHLQTNELPTAEALMKQALAVNPNHGPALSNLALALRLQSKPDEALACFDRAIAAQANPETEFNRALLLLDLRRPADALIGFDRALAGAPNHVGAQIGRGNALERLNRLPEAVAAYNRACIIQPQSVEAHHNLGCALHSSGRIDDARAQFHAALQLNPNFAETHLVLAESHLLTGDFAAGWSEYEWRWRIDGMMAAQRREFAQNRWAGEDIAGRTILLWAEQGFGDMLQFCRFASVVAARGARVLLEVPDELAEIMGGLKGVSQVIRRGEALPPFDVQCPLMSLPLALGAAAQPETTAVPYLTADAFRRDAWRARLESTAERRIGIVWSGRKTHRNNHARSIPLATLAPLFALPGIRLVALQPDISAEDIATGLPVTAGPASFVETAAAIDALDLVITVDTAIAHLAGALGKPVWVLLPMVPDWRWQLGRSDSPWYPTARLFRQSTPGDWPGVIADLITALTDVPPEAALARGNENFTLGRFTDAVADYDAALSRNPEFPQAHHNRGSALRRLGRMDEALASFERAATLAPAYADAHLSRGNLLLELQRPAEALASYDRAIAAKPDFAGVYINRAAALAAMRRLPEAVASYDQALALNPERAETHFTRANTLLALNRPEEACAGYESALALKPDYDFLPGLLTYTRAKLCDWTAHGERLDALRAAVSAGKKASAPFPLLTLFDEPQLHKQAATLYTQTRHPRRMTLGPVAKPDHHQRLRIGYFSADYRNHPMACLLAELFESHDRSRFEIFGFSIGPDKQDDMRKRIAAGFEHFLDVRAQNDLAIAQMARERGIDIAVDLNAHTQDSRPGIFAEGCAPVQVNFLSYPGTMGADYIDYIVADKTVIPRERHGDFTEKVITMPHCYQVNDSKRRISDRVFTRTALGLPAQGFVFCCFNNNHKILPATFEIWMRVLKAVEGSVLWLLEDNATAARNLRKEAAARGVDPQRLVFAGRMSLADHLARHRLADLFLDTLPYNAHTTASDALWAGLPVLTCTGIAFASRVAASLLMTLGLPELITDSPEAYEAKALELARDPAKLRVLREALAARRDTTPLFDAKLFAKDLEAAYTLMYERSQAGLPPEAFAVG